MFRGDIWLVDLDPTVGHEQAKTRLCLVISVEQYHQGSGELAVVIPLTSQYRPLRWLVPVNPPEGGLSKSSYIMCHQPRTVSVARFSGERVGKVGPQILEQVHQRLRFLLGL